MEIWVYLFAAAFLVLVLVLYLRKQGQARALQQALTSLAQARGWRASHSREGGRWISVITPGDPAEDWHLHMESGEATGGRRSITYLPGVTELVFPALRWRAGHAFFAQDRDRGYTRKVGGTGLIDSFRTDHALRMLGNGVPPDIAAMAAELQDFEPPNGIALAILATADPAGLDLAAVAEAIATWRERTWSWHSGRPATVSIGPNGLRWRLSDGLSRAEQVGLFMDLGLDLARRLQPGAAAATPVEAG